MLSKSFILLFYLKKRNNYQGRKLPIYLRFTVDGQRIELTAKQECEPARWNSALGRMTGSKEDSRNLNAYPDSLKLKFLKRTRLLSIQENKITAENIKNKLSGVSDRPNTGDICSTQSRDGSIDRQGLCHRDLQPV
jgi:hypothetical protein